MRRIVFSFLVFFCTACGYDRFGDLAVDSSVWSVTTTFDRLPRGATFERSTVAQGVAVTCDSAGSFYRELIVQDFDSGTALTIKLGFYDIYAWLRTGMVVAVEFRGLAVVDSMGVLMAGLLNEGDGSVAELGEPSVAALHLRFQGRYEPLRPKVKMIGQINHSDLGRLIRIDKTYFAEGGKNYYKGERLVGELFSENSIPLYTPSGALFATKTLPRSISSMWAVVSQFGGKMQLRIADTTWIFPPTDR